MEERRQSLHAAINHEEEPVSHETPTNTTNEITEDTASSSRRRRVRSSLAGGAGRTVAAALLMCLHLGIDPPDSLRPPEAGRLLAWLDPQELQVTLSAQQTAEQIARACAAQYEWWQAKMRLKWLVDPTAEDVRRLLLALRKSSREERVLVHYSGHGVPRPTAAGELWLFNRQFTQYIPLTLNELVEWVGTPCCLVLDCTGVDGLLASLKGSEGVMALGAATLLETLPTCAAMPADLLTACLTTPIEVALRWHGYAQHALLPPSLTHKHAALPSQDHALQGNPLLSLAGKLGDRRTPLGHLNWLFTAITDTIAWLSLPRAQFKLLFRQDALMASLWRNALLAQRLLRFFHCTLQSLPPLPLCNQHVMWQHWDLALDQEWQRAMEEEKGCGSGGGGEESADTLKRPRQVAPSAFWWDQLEAFDQAISRAYLRNNARWRGGAEHLPCLLQALLSPTLRPHALASLGRFMLLNRTTAIEDVLAVGLYPYLVKLLGSEESGLVLIWMALIEANPMLEKTSLRVDLGKEAGWRYFLQPRPQEPALIRAACLAILAWWTFLGEGEREGEDEAEMEKVGDLTPTEDGWTETWTLILLRGRANPPQATTADLTRPQHWRAALKLAGLYGGQDDPSPLLQLQGEALFNVLFHQFHLLLRRTFGERSQPAESDEADYDNISFYCPSEFVACAKWEVEDGLITAGWLDDTHLWLGDQNGRVR